MTVTAFIVTNVVSLLLFAAGYWARGWVDRPSRLSPVVSQVCALLEDPCEEWERRVHRHVDAYGDGFNQRSLILSGGAVEADVCSRCGILGTREQTGAERRAIRRSFRICEDNIMQRKLGMLPPAKELKELTG